MAFSASFAPSPANTLASYSSFNLQPMNEFMKLIYPTTLSNFFCIFSSFNLTSFKASPSAWQRYLTFSDSDLIEKITEQILTKLAAGSAFGSNISARLIPDLSAKLNL